MSSKEEIQNVIDKLEKLPASDLLTEIIMDLSNYITQQPTLDSEVEEELELIHAMIYAYTELQSDNLTIEESRILITNSLMPLNTIKQALVDKEEEIKDKDAVEQSLMRMSLSSQAKLDKIEKMLNSQHPMSYKLGRIKQMLKEDNNENS